MSADSSAAGRSGPVSITSGTRSPRAVNACATEGARISSASRCARAIALNCAARRRSGSTARIRDMGSYVRSMHMTSTAATTTSMVIGACSKL
jgi:hypothetical protein